MGGRYFLTGVQIGLLRGLIETNQIASALDVLTEIEHEQFIGSKHDFEKKFGKRE